MTGEAAPEAESTEAVPPVLPNTPAVAEPPAEPAEPVEPAEPAEPVSVAPASGADPIAAGPSEPAPVPQQVDPFDAAPLSREPDEREEEPEDEFNRHGFAMSVGAGLINCSADICATAPIGGVGRIEVGYRFGVVSVLGGFGFGGASVEPKDFLGVNDSIDPSTKAKLRYLDAGAGLSVLPVRSGRFDPFLTALIGDSRVRFRSTAGDSEYTFELPRPAARVGAGFGIYVAGPFSIGPRFDIVLPFAGKVCEEQDGEPFESDAEDICESVSSFIDSAESKVGERVGRRELPKPWSFVIDFRAVF